MDWTHAEVVHLASRRCVRCRGLGLTGDIGGVAGEPCPCVLRSIFRICLAKFRSVAPGYRNYEYAADFLSCARRSLASADHRLFVSRYILEASLEQINVQLGRPRDERSTHRDFYRIEHALAHAFCSQQPYALFPIEDYFRRETNRAVATALRLPDTRQRLNVPLKKAA